jgi:hypothetical protein
MIQLEQLTKPFSVIQNQPQDVRNKFLEGVPWKDGYFPGPFLGAMTNQEKNDYMQTQRDAVLDYKHIAATPLQDQEERYPSFNEDGYTDCSQYGKEIPMFPPNRQDTYKYPYQAGTGAPKIEEFKDSNLSNPCSETGFGEIVPQFIQCRAEGNPLLDISQRPIQQFSHNNMVPKYGAKLTQNMYSTGVAQAGDNNTCDENLVGFADKTPYRGKLENFTGCDETYLHKRETGRMFSPAEQQTGWVYGMPGFRPDLSQFKQTLNIKNNESPVEKIQVGPGIGLTYNAPSVGGFQQFTRILPNNVNDYKSNQLENRINAGKWMNDHPTSQYINGVHKNKPTVEITQARRPTMPSKFYTSAPDANSSRVTDYNIQTSRGKQARPETEQSQGYGQLNRGIDSKNLPCVTFGKAPIGRTMKANVPMPTQDLQSYDQINETFKSGTAGWTPQTGYYECPILPQGSYRWDLFGGPAGGVMNDTQRTGWNVNYTMRGDLNPFVINATGTASKTGGIWNPNSYQDPIRTTLKETLDYSYHGNATPGIKMYNPNSHEDQQRVTTKETLMYNYNGNPSGNINKHYEYTYSDLPPVKMAETTLYSHSGGPAGGVQMTNREMFTGSYM